MSTDFDALRFCWHVDETVAGSARPGRYADICSDLERLKSEGIKLIINLCVEPLEVAPEFQGVFQVMHVPVTDGHPPTPEQLKRVIDLVQQARERKRRVLVHCRGGVGRTATVLIPLIMELTGKSMDEAMEMIRDKGRYTQSMEQWEFLQSWEKERQD